MKYDDTRCMPRAKYARRQITKIDNLFYLLTNIYTYEKTKTITRGRSPHGRGNDR